MISDSQGDNPAFLQMNQNGRTPTTATITATIKIITNSGIPIGPIIFVFVWFGLNFLQNVKCPPTGATEKEVEK